MRPAQLDRLFPRFAGQQPIKESSRKTIPATNAIINVQLRRGSLVRPPINPRHRAPAMPVRGMHFPQSGRDDFDLRMLLKHVLHHAEKRARVELRFRRNLRPWNPETLL